RPARGTVAGRGLVAGVAGMAPPALGPSRGRAGPPRRGRRRVHRAVGPAPEFPRRRGTGRDAAAARGHPACGRATRPGHVPLLETHAERGGGTVDAVAARPALVPQGPVPVPLLRPRRRHGAGPRVARPGPPDRPAPAGVPPLDMACVAGEGPGSAAVFL